MSRTFLLQDWTTIRSSLSGSFIQDPDSWLDLDGYSDVTCWIDVAEVTPRIAALPLCVQLQIETAPSCDDSYFVPISPPLDVGASSPFVQPSTSPNILRSAKTSVSNNLMRFLRWKITAQGSSGTWDLTFRIHAIAARSPTFVPPLVPGCVVWYRADLGVTLSGSSVTAWNDQSGTGDPNKNLTTGVSPTFNAADPAYNGQSTITFTRASGDYLKTAIWASAVAQPNTWIVVGHANSTSLGEAAIDCNDAAGGQNLGRNPSNKIDMNAGSSLQYADAWGAPSAALVEFHGSQSAIYFNDFTSPRATGNAGARGQSSLAVGSSDPQPSGPGNYWDGPIAEIIGYSGVLSSSFKAQLRAYLVGRYGIAIG